MLPLLTLSVEYSPAPIWVTNVEPSGYCTPVTPSTCIAASDSNGQEVVTVYWHCEQTDDPGFVARRRVCHYRQVVSLRDNFRVYMTYWSAPVLLLSTNMFCYNAPDIYSKSGTSQDPTQSSEQSDRAHKSGTSLCTFAKGSTVQKMNSSPVKPNSISAVVSNTNQGYTARE